MSFFKRPTRAEIRRPHKERAEKALQAECAAMDSFNRAAEQAKKRQPEIDALRERVKKNGLNKKESTCEDELR